MMLLEFVPASFFFGGGGPQAQQIPQKYTSH